MYKSIVFIITLSVCISIGNCINCHQCNSLTDVDCEKILSNNTKYLKPCTDDGNNHTYFCRKTAFTILDEVKVVRVIRACGWEVYKHNKSYCIQSDTDFKYQKSCQCFTDGCNSSTNLRQDLIMVPLLLSAFYLIYNTFL